MSKDTDTFPDLAALHAQLQAIQAPLSDGQLDGIQVLLQRHDQDLRQFLQSRSGRGSSHAQLSALLTAQQALSQAMTRMRDEAGMQLQRLQHSHRAAHSYASIGGHAFDGHST